MIERKMDKRGRIMLPREVWEQLGIQPGGAVEFDLIRDEIILQRPKNRCRFCGTTENVDSRLHLCTACMEEIRIQDEMRLAARRA